MRKYVYGMMAVATLAIAHDSAFAALYRVDGGSVSMVLQEGKANSIYEFSSYFDATATRTQTLSDPEPGNAPFSESPVDPSIGTITLSDPIRPYGVVPTPYPGTPGSTRSPQLTTLEFDTSDVLGSWSVSNDSFGFTGNTTLGEQIALTSMQRWTGPFTGSLLYGDFALRYTGSKLHLTSNIDFLNAEYAEIGNPNITVTPNTLTITGDLLIDQGLSLLDGSAIPGTDFGDFTLVANISPVPEPASAGIIALSATFLVRRRRATSL